MWAVLYARVSSKDQEREGFSIPAQLKLLRQYAREHGLTVVREFVDVETAKQTGRTGFGQMLAFLKAEPSCHTILVEKTDRLYRNLKDWVRLDDLPLEIHLVKEATILSPESRSNEKFMQGSGC
jgi:DNA invertase Pin-like site-specific DNA recombinase